MSTTTVEYSSLSIKGNGQANSPPIVTQVAQGQCRDTTIHSPDTHISAFHQTSHELVDAFSRIPWMSFNIVAKPDLNLLANNEVITKFIHHVTDMTISIVSEEIHQEVTVAVNEVIRGIAQSVNKKMEAVHANIMKGIISIDPEWTATECDKLDFPPLKDLVKEVTGDQKHSCHCSSETIDPAPTSTPVPIVVKPAPTPEPVVFNPTRGSEPPVKPVEAAIVVPAKPSIVPPPTLKAASWIWTPEYKTNRQPPIGTTRAFRRTIGTPSPVDALTIDASADDLYTVYVNGKLVGCGSNWFEPDRYSIRFEPTSRVVVTIVASQGTAQMDVGLIAAFKVWNTADANPVPLEFRTDSQWRTVGADVSEKFVQAAFDDAAWTAAHVIAPGTGWKDAMKPATPGKAAGKRIVGMPQIPDAPNSPVAEEWKF